MSGQLSNGGSVFFYYRRLGRVEKFVRDNLGEPIGLEDAAGAAGLEPKYFSAYFRKKTGICFRHWLSAVRVNKAKVLMRAQDHTITDIAFCTGFRDLRTFERAFKTHTGMTPSDYKCSVIAGREACSGNMPD